MPWWPWNIFLWFWPSSSFPFLHSPENAANILGALKCGGKILGKGLRVSLSSQLSEVIPSSSLDALGKVVEDRLMGTGSQTLEAGQGLQYGSQNKPCVPLFLPPPSLVSIPSPYLPCQEATIEKISSRLNCCRKTFNG